MLGVEGVLFLTMADREVAAYSPLVNDLGSGADGTAIN